MIRPPARRSARLTLSAAGFIAISTSGASPAVSIEAEPKLIWNAETPKVVPCGARISAGKSGKVARSLPASAVDKVKRPPVSCIPSPESPAKRTTTESSAGGGRMAAPESVDTMPMFSCPSAIAFNPYALSTAWLDGPIMPRFQTTASERRGRVFTPPACQPCAGRRSMWLRTGRRPSAPPIPGAADGSGGPQARDARITTVGDQSAGFGELGGGALALALESINRSEVGTNSEILRIGAPRFLEPDDRLVDT